MKVKFYLTLLSVFLMAMGLTMVTKGEGWVEALGVFIAIWANNIDRANDDD